MKSRYIYIVRTLDNGRYEVEADRYVISGDLIIFYHQNDDIACFSSKTLINIFKYEN